MWGVGSRTFPKPWAKPNSFELCRGEENVCYAQHPVAVLRFRFHISGHAVRAAPCVSFHAVNPSLNAFRTVTLELSFNLFTTFLILFKYRFHAAAITSHQPRCQILHVRLRSSKHNAILFVVVETNSVHYQKHRYLMLHALRFPLFDFVVHIL